jgi:hypothetical protein
MRNYRQKASGASKISKTCVSTSSLGLLNPGRRQWIHQEQEVYHHLYKHKLEKLIKEALINVSQSSRRFPTSAMMRMRAMAMTMIHPRGMLPSPARRR